MPKTNQKTGKKPAAAAKGKAMLAKGGKAAAAKTPEKARKESVKMKSSKETKKIEVKQADKQTKKAPKVPFKKEVTQKLLDAKSKILQEVSQKVRSESDILKFEIGDIYDIASNERERELALMLGDRDREKLSEIEDALERIRESTYGECEECGEPIAEDRLRALPFTRVCVECQFKNEREQRIKGRVYEEESGLGIMEKSESEEEEF